MHWKIRYWWHFFTTKCNKNDSRFVSDISWIHSHLPMKADNVKISKMLYNVSECNQMWHRWWPNSSKWRHRSLLRSFPIQFRCFRTHFPLFRHHFQLVSHQQQKKFLFSSNLFDQFSIFFFLFNQISERKVVSNDIRKFIENQNNRNMQWQIAKQLETPPKFTSFS